jgi:hypothetical protein
MTSTLALMVFCARGLGFTEPVGPQLEAAIDACMAHERPEYVAAAKTHPKPTIKRDGTSRSSDWVCRSEVADAYRITARGDTPRQAFRRWLKCMFEIAAQPHHYGKPEVWTTMQAAAEHFEGLLPVDIDFHEFPRFFEIEAVPIKAAA